MELVMDGDGEVVRPLKQEAEQWAESRTGGTRAG